MTVKNNAGILLMYARLAVPWSVDGLRRGSVGLGWHCNSGSVPLGTGPNDRTTKWQREHSLQHSQLACSTLALLFD